MVCKKCGRAIEGNYKICPYCGVGLETENKVGSFNDELENLKIEENTSIFDSKKDPKIDIENIIEDLEDLKIKEEKKDEDVIPKVEMISDEELEDVLEDIIEYKKQQKEIKKEQEKLKEKEEISIKEDIFKAIDENNNKEETKENEEIYNAQKIANDDENPIRDDIFKTVNEDKTKEEDNLFIKNIDAIQNEPRKIHIPFEMEEKKKNKVASKAILIFISVFSILFFISIFIVYKNSFSPKAKLFNTLEVSYNEFDKIIEKITNNYDILKGMDIVEVSSKANIYESLDYKMNNRIVTTKYIQDNKEKRQYFEYNNDNNKFISFIQNDKLYINQENNSDKFYTTNSKYIGILNILDRENNNYLKELLIDTIKDEINGHDFNQDKVKEKHNEKEYNLKRVSLELSEDKFNKLLIKIINEIKTDANAINIIEENTKYTTDEIKKYFSDVSNKLKSKTSSDTVFEYSIYFDNHDNIIRQMIKYENKLSLDYWNIGKKKDIKLELNENNKYDLTINDNYDDLNLNLKQNNETEINILYSKQDNKYVVNYQINKLNSTVDKQRKIVNIISKPKKENNKYTNEININVDSNMNGENLKQIIYITNEINEIKEVPSFDINDSDKIKPITNEIKKQYMNYFSYFLK